MIGGGKARRSFMQLIWLLCVWIVWNEHNRMFNDVATPVPRLLDKVKLMSLRWLKAKKVTFIFGTLTWWSRLLICFGIG